jgi:threonine dehydratase
MHQASPYATDLAAIRRAQERIATHAHRTPVATSRTLNAIAGRALFFKCENLQRGGAFKIRGACNAVFALDDEAAARGVVTHSSGNHAQALAIAARIRGIVAHVVMPTTAPRPKREAAIGYGARIIDCAPTLEAREEMAARVVADTGATLIPPYDHPDVIAGQGTIALELLEDVPDLDAIVAPVGGGGLVSGIALAVNELAPKVKVIAAEPAGADDAARSKRERRRVLQTAPNTIADGLRTSLGTLTWPVIRDLVDRVITVEEDAIRAAMRLVFERMKLVIEPSAAVAVAAVLGDALRDEPELRTVAVVLSGGNVELPWDAIAR